MELFVSIFTNFEVDFDNVVAKNEFLNHISTFEIINFLSDFKEVEFENEDAKHAREEIIRYYMFTHLEGQTLTFTE